MSKLALLGGEKAIKTVIKVANERGDTNDVKRFQNIPENIFILK